MSEPAYTYRVVRRIGRRGWWLLCDTRATPIASYATRKAAVTAARLLAGWRGTVTVESR